MQQHEVAPAGVAERRDRLGDLVRRRHAGRQDGRAAGRGDAPNQRQIDQLERRDLVGRRIELFEEIDRGVVERRREHRDAELAAFGEQRRMPVPRRVRLLVELVEAAAVPQAALDAEFRPVMVDGDRVGRVGLQLDRVGAGRLGGVHHGERMVETAAMIGGKLRHHVGRLARANGAAGDVDFRLSHKCPIKVMPTLARR